MNEGLSGWLSPEGKFYSSEHMKHSEVAMKIINEDSALAKKRMELGMEKGTVLYHDRALGLMDWIVMGCNPYFENDTDYIFFPTHDLKWRCSDEQLNWLKENISSMRKNQLQMYKEHTKFYKDQKERKTDIIMEKEISKIPQHIKNKADKIIKNVKENTRLEKEIRDWIKSKNVEVDELGDTMACLMYAEYIDGEHFAKTLLTEMKEGYVI